MQLHEARYQEYSCELKTLLQLVESVHSNYEAGDTYALFYGIYVNSRVDMERLKKCFMAYGVIFMEPTQQNTATAYELGVIREAGLAGTKRMLMELKQLQGSDLDLNQAFAHQANLNEEIRTFRTICKNLVYLLRRGVSAKDINTRVESLLQAVDMSPALQNAPREQRLEGLTQSYCHLCELVLTGSTTKAAFQDLERLVKQELDATEEQLRELNSLKQRYVEQGRHDLKILLQEHAEAARKAHYGDNVNSDEDSLQVSELLDRIDNCLATIGDAFQRSQAFWKDIHQNLVKANHWQWEHPASKVERDVIGLESLLPDVRSVVASAQQSTGVKKILAAGVDLVAGAAAVTANCEAIGRAQSAVESQLTSGKASGSPELKEARHAVKSLNRELSSVVGRHAKLSECFRKYSRDVSLLFWSGAARRQERNFEPLVHAVVASHRLPPHQSAFEAAFIGMDSELRGLQASWTV